MQIKREHHINFWFIIVALIGIMAIQTVAMIPKVSKTIPYSEFQRLLDEGQVSDLVVGQDQITGTLKEARSNEPQYFSTYRVPIDLADRLAKANVAFSGEPSAGAVESLLGWMLPTIGFLLIWMYMIRPMTGQGLGGMMAVGKSKAKIYRRNRHQGHLRRRRRGR